MKGLNFHCFTASAAALARTGSPLTTSTVSTSPISETTALTITLPCNFCDKAADGYSGLTFLTNSRTVESGGGVVAAGFACSAWASGLFSTGGDFWASRKVAAKKPNRKTIPRRRIARNSTALVARCKGLRAHARRAILRMVRRGQQLTVADLKVFDRFVHNPCRSSYEASLLGYTVLRRYCHVRSSTNLSRS